MKYTISKLTILIALLALGSCRYSESYTYDVLSAAQDTIIVKFGLTDGSDSTIIIPPVEYTSTQGRTIRGVSITENSDIFKNVTISASDSILYTSNPIKKEDWQEVVLTPSNYFFATPAGTFTQRYIAVGYPFEQYSFYVSGTFDSTYTITFKTDRFDSTITFRNGIKFYAPPSRFIRGIIVHDITGIRKRASQYLSSIKIATNTGQILYSSTSPILSNKWNVEFPIGGQSSLSDNSLEIMFRLRLN